MGLTSPLLGQTLGIFEGPASLGELIKIPNDPLPTPLTGKFVVIQVNHTLAALGLTEVRKTCQLEEEGGVFKNKNYVKCF